MKKIKYTFLSALLFVGVSATLVSCEEDDAEITILSEVAGDYIGTENCGGALGDYTVSVYNTADDAGKVWVEHIYGIAPRMQATVSGKSFTLPSTPFDYKVGNTTYKLAASATGTVEGDSLKMEFQISGDFSDACTFKGNRATVLKPAGSTP